MLPQIVGRVRFSRAALGGAVPEVDPEMLGRIGPQFSYKQLIAIGTHMQDATFPPRYELPHTIRSQERVTIGPRNAVSERYWAFSKTSIDLPLDLRTSGFADGPSALDLLATIATLRPQTTILNLGCATGPARCCHWTGRLLQPSGAEAPDFFFSA